MRCTVALIEVQNTSSILCIQDMVELMDSSINWLHQVTSLITRIGWILFLLWCIQTAQICTFTFLFPGQEFGQTIGHCCVIFTAFYTNYCVSPIPALLSSHWPDSFIPCIFMAACERLVLLNHDPRELRDYAALLYHCGYYEDCLKYLTSYQTAMVIHLQTQWSVIVEITTPLNVTLHWSFPSRLGSLRTIHWRSWRRTRWILLEHE